MGAGKRERGPLILGLAQRMEKTGRARLVSPNAEMGRIEDSDVLGEQHGNLGESLRFSGLRPR